MAEQATSVSGNVIGGLPLQIRHKVHADAFLGKRALEVGTAKYGYFLIDFVNRRDAPIEKVFSADSGNTIRKISDEITWRMVCRSNGKGFLVPWDPESVKPPMDPDSDVEKKKLDVTRPVLFNLGQEFNLWWGYTYQSFRNVYEGKGREKVSKENQIFKVSTYIDAQEEKSFLKVFYGLNPNFKELAVSDKKALVDAVKRQVVRESGKIKRYTLSFFGTGYVNSIYLENYPLHQILTALNIKAHSSPATFSGSFWPSIELRDECLEQSILLSEDILKATGLTKYYNVFEYVARVRRLVDIIKNREKEKSFNDIIPVMVRENNVNGTYSHLLSDLEDGFGQINRYVADSGKRLDKIYGNAMNEAIWHYPPDRSVAYQALIMDAMGLNYCEALYSMIGGSDYQKIEKILKGEIHEHDNDGVEKYLDYMQTFADRAGKFTELLDKGTGVIEGMIGKLILKNELNSEFTKTFLNRVNKVLYYLTNSQGTELLEPKTGVVLKDLVFTEKEISLAFEVEGKAGKFTTKVLELQEKMKLAGRMDRIFKFVNVGFALKDFKRDPSVKNSMGVLNAAAEFASAVDKIKSLLYRFYGITEEFLVKVAGASAAIYALYDATEMFAQGNNIAVLGDMMIVSAGCIKVIMGDTGGYGVLIALIIIAGTVVIFLSLDDDEKYVLDYERHHDSANYSRISIKEFLKKGSNYLSRVDDFIAAKGV